MQDSAAREEFGDLGEEQSFEHECHEAVEVEGLQLKRSCTHVDAAQPASKRTSVMITKNDEEHQPQLAVKSVEPAIAAPPEHLAAALAAPGGGMETA